MKNKKKLVAGVMAVLMMASALTIPASAYGNDNDVYFTFKVKSEEKWSNTEKYFYRGATTTATPWKVEFTGSGEGRETKTIFFLVKEADTNYKLSEFKTVTQGSGVKYYRAYDEACEIDVRLGAKNNNYISTGYNVSGYWDEETAQHDFSD